MKKLANQIIVVDAKIGGVKKCDMRSKIVVSNLRGHCTYADGDLRQLR